jgi:hypothetical protein
VSPELQAARVANARYLAERTRSNLELTPAQRAERLALAEAQRKAEGVARNPASNLSPSDRAFVNPDTEEGQRNLRRAADPTRRSARPPSTRPARWISPNGPGSYPGSSTAPACPAPT